MHLPPSGVSSVNFITTCPKHQPLIQNMIMHLHLQQVYHDEDFRVPISDEEVSSAVFECGVTAVGLSKAFKFVSDSRMISVVVI